MSLGLPPLSLYVHLPWCVQKCPYCDFNSHQLAALLPEQQYLDALIRDFQLSAGEVGQTKIESIFFGGGTPSLFSAASFERLIQAVKQRFELSESLEVTMEANPGTIEYAPLKEYVDAGINRLSLGVQSFNTPALKRLGRIHGEKEATKALHQAVDAGFEQINADLMYALPGQSLSQALEDVEHLLSLGVSHISHYQLTIEPNTLFAAKPPVLPESDLAWEMQESCQQRLADAGYVQYEVSAYAQDNAQCRHNLNYWLFGDYLGIGAGAHGKITDSQGRKVSRQLKLKHPAAFMQQAGKPACSAELRVLTETDLRFEFVLNALRLRRGFDRQLYESRTGLSLELDQEPWSKALEAGWLIVENEQLMATDMGQRFLNNLLELFLEH